MNVKPVLRYQLREYFKVFSIFYGVIYSLIVFTLLHKYAKSASDGGISGMEISTMVACFIIGLVMFKNTFRFFTSCGVSRRRLFCSLTAAIAVTAAAVSLLDMINAAVFSNFIDYTTFYAGLTQNQLKSGSVDFIMGEVHIRLPVYTAGFLLKDWLWCLLADFALGMLGFLIAALYFRMSKPVKILVSVGVPAFCFVFLPLLDFNVTHGIIGRFVAASWAQWTHWGLNPGPDLLTRLALTALFAGGVWLLLRKAEVYH